MTMLKVACVQMTSGPDIDDNLKLAEGYIREAAAQGARFILTPENTCQMRFPLKKRMMEAVAQEEHAGVPFFSALAKELEVTLCIGSLPIRVSDNKTANRSFLFGPDGGLIATYDKIHLFDVDLPTGEQVRESSIIEAGGEAIVANAGFAKIGMSVCYDVRFPHLYRDMAKAGADMLLVPAAFSMPTGAAHWETFLRARAIETGSFVLAAGQTGTHQHDQQTWGHSMIISPWGEILAALDDKPGIISADLNLDDVAKVRGSIPALQHDRDYKLNS